MSLEPARPTHAQWCRLRITAEQAERTGTMTMGVACTCYEELSDAFRAVSRLGLRLEAQNAQLQQHCATLWMALADCVDALAYVEDTHASLPGLTGGGVRLQRVREARAILAATAPAAPGEPGND